MSLFAVAARVVPVAVVVVVVAAAGCGLLDGTGVYNDPVHGDVVRCTRSEVVTRDSCRCSITPLSAFDEVSETFSCSVDDTTPGRCCLGPRSSTAAAFCICTFDESDDVGGPAEPCLDDEDEVPSCLDLEPERYQAGSG